MEINPDLAAHFRPAFAKAEVFAEVDAAVFIDQTVEERAAPLAAAEIVFVSVIVAVFQFRIVLNHGEQGLAFDQEKASASVCDSGEAVHHLNAVSGEFDHIGEGGGFERHSFCFDARLYFPPVDPFDGIDGGRNILVELHKAEYLAGLEADIGVYE